MAPRSGAGGGAVSVVICKMDEFSSQLKDLDKGKGKDFGEDFNTQTF